MELEDFLYYRIGTRVLANSKTWRSTPSDYITARGIGIGVVAIPPPSVSDTYTKVIWRGGSSWEDADQLTRLEALPWRLSHFLRRHEPSRTFIAQRSSDTPGLYEIWIDLEARPAQCLATNIWPVELEAILGEMTLKGDLVNYAPDAQHYWDFSAKCWRRDEKDSVGSEAQA